MGVYIKDIEMPIDGCKDCIFVNRKWLSDICPFLKREVTGNVERGGFQTDCPLISVPPHRRLIDADKLADRCSRQARDGWNKSTSTTNWGYAYAIFKSDVEDAPTIIPAEEDE